MKTKGPIAFLKRNDGSPRRTRVDELTHATINKSLQRLRALLNLAHAEKVITAAPKIGLLPEDDSTPVIPPRKRSFERC